MSSVDDYSNWPDLELTVRSAGRQLTDRRRARTASRLLGMLVVVLLAAAALVAAFPYLARSSADAQLTRAADKAASQALGFPYDTRSSMIEQAVKYNRDLAASGQPTLGVSKDPFSGDRSGDWDGSDDKQYGKLLDLDGTGTMGRIRIPKISVDLRIGHGSGQNTLENGAGHLHGTSLPVGGKSTHTVITAHTDFNKGSMFDRLTELKKGDPFYIEVMGRTLAYKIDDIRVTDPIEKQSGQFDALKVKKGADMATLITCTGPGLTQRLWATGVRNRMPDQLPYPDQAAGDAKRALIQAGTVTGLALAAGLSIVMIRRRRHARRGVDVGAPAHERAKGVRRH